MDMKSFDIIIIGAGPGGYVCAIRAAQLGLKVCCIDSRDTLGGTCLNVGCIPSKALLESSHLYHMAQTEFAQHGINCPSIKLNLKHMLQRKNNVVQKLTQGITYLMKKNKITTMQGHAKFTAPHQLQVAQQQITAPHIVIATGSTPIEIPNAPFDNKYITSSTEALEFTTVPEKLAVIGGGVIGLEMASIWSRLGSQVTVIEAQPRLLSDMDNDCANTIKKIMQKHNVEFQLNTTLQNATVQKNHVKLTYGDQTNTFNKVLVAVGRKAYTQNLELNKANIQTNQRGEIIVDAQWQTNTAGVYAIGDVIGGAMLAHKAEEEGVAVAENIAGHTGHVNYHAIPAIVYTFPEVVAVGMTAEQAQTQGLQIKTSKFPFSANGRALAAGHNEGFVKIIADANTDEMLGTHIVGAQASELIAELALAREYRASAEDIARTVHAHPNPSRSNQRSRARDCRKDNTRMIIHTQLSFYTRGRLSFYTRGRSPLSCSPPSRALPPCLCFH